VSRRKQGRNRRRTAARLLARTPQHVRRRRHDFQHTAALALVRAYDTLSHDDVPTATMVRNHHLATSSSDAGWSAFRTILSFQAACAGRRVVAAPPAYTSHACSGCGVLVHTGVSVRWHSCPDCGASLQRDHNAAKNIHWRGQRLRGVPA
jgi:putative transposase